jgi:protein gp37
MGAKTAIPWWDATWPVVTGCSPVSAGKEWSQLPGGNNVA